MRLLLFRRDPERAHVHARRVEPGEQRADDAVLPAGIHRLQHHEHGVALGREQPGLEVRQHGELLGQLRLRRLLVPAERLSRIVIRQLQLGTDAARRQHALGHGRPTYRRCRHRGDDRVTNDAPCTAAGDVDGYGDAVPCRDCRHTAEGTGADQTATPDRWGSTRMHVRPTTHRRRVGRYVAAALVSFSLVAAACGDKKDDDAVATDDTEAEVEETTPPDDGATEDTADVTTPETETTEAPAPVVTEPPESEFDPVIGGKLVVAGEAEAANPWTPANVQCDSFCQMRVRTVLRPAGHRRRRARACSRTSPRASRPTRTRPSSRSRSARASRSTTGRRSTPTP